MLLASVDFASLHSSVSGIPAMMLAFWSIFLAIPFALVITRGLLAMIESRLSSPVRTARNGRLYCVVAGRPPVWARRGETGAQLAIRCAAL